jgi:hypothetical protein
LNESSFGSFGGVACGNTNGDDKTKTDWKDEISFRKKKYSFEMRFSQF